MFRRRLPMPAPRLLPWPLKPLSSAVTSLRYDTRGRMVMHIRHDLLKGLSPAMVAWWFAHIGGEMEIDGVRVNRYLAWHPLDHIHWRLAKPAPGGGAGPGAKFRIVEAFGRNPDFYVDVIDTVLRLDATGLTLAAYKLGIEVSRLTHDFTAIGLDTQYVSTLTIGSGVAGLSAMLNPILHRAAFTEAMGYAWLRHNVEEVGLLEHIVPRLYPRAAH